MAENNSDPNRMAQLLTEEVSEVLEVLDNPEKLAQELSDVVWFCITIAELNGIDLSETFREKAAFFHVRYQAQYFQEGDYDEARARVKREEPERYREFYGE
jgi:NTP pyrophosphatase (non-canonical NTP hydrolase)